MNRQGLTVARVDRLAMTQASAGVPFAAPGATMPPVSGLPILTAESHGASGATLRGAAVENAHPRPDRHDRTQACRPWDPEAIGPYRILGRLGSGGMGRVFLGRGNDDRLVAVKVVHAEFAGQPEFRARLAREVSVASQVASPFTAALLDADTTAMPQWMATEYIAGPTLGQHVREQGKLTANEARLVGSAVAAALEAIHGVGVIHRDLKPSNVILGPTGARVIDFGIAGGLEATALTRQGSLIGTLSWMAPEQIRGQAATESADIFSWALLTAWAALGRHPFGDGKPETLAVRILTGDPDLTGLEPGLSSVIRAALEKNPIDRPSSRDLHALLWAPDLPGPEARPTSLATPGVAVATKPSERHPRMEESEATPVTRSRQVRNRRWGWMALPLFIALAVATISAVDSLGAADATRGDSRAAQAPVGTGSTVRDADSATGTVETSTSGAGETNGAGETSSSTRQSTDGESVNAQPGVDRGPAAAGTYGVAGTIALGSTYTNVLMSHDGQRVYASDEGSSRIYVIDSEMGVIEQTLETGAPPEAIAESPDGNWLFVARSGSDSVRAIRMADGSGQDIPVGADARGLDVSVEGTRLYVALTDERSIATVDLDTGRVVTRIALDIAPNTVRVTPDGDSLVISSARDDALRVVDLRSNEIWGVPLGDSPRRVRVSSDGKLAVTANVNAGTVSIVSLSTHSEVARIDVGGSPRAAEFTPDGRHVLVADKSRGIVSVIDIASGNVTQTLSVSSELSAVVIHPSGDRAYVAHPGGMTVLTLS